MDKKTMIQQFLFVLLIIYSLKNSYGQSLGLNNSNPDNSSILDASATDRGVLIPRMTSIQRNAILKPAKSLLVFDNTANLYYYNAGDTASPNWVALNQGWHGSTNRIKILPTDFLSNQINKENSFTFNESVTNKGVTSGFKDNHLFAFIAIPAGYKATHVKIFGNNPDTYYVYESELSTGTWSTSKGSSTVGNEVDIIDIISTASNFIAIEIYSTNLTNLIYGGYVTISAL
jgi:hypothetical protein